MPTYRISGHAMRTSCPWWRRHSWSMWERYFRPMTLYGTINPSPMVGETRQRRVCQVCGYTQDRSTNV